MERDLCLLEASCSASIVIDTVVPVIVRSDVLPALVMFRVGRNECASSLVLRCSRRRRSPSADQVGSAYRSARFVELTRTEHLLRSRSNSKQCISMEFAIGTRHYVICYVPTH
jgi:hypothetical protein